MRRSRIHTVACLAAIPLAGCGVDAAKEAAATSKAATATASAAGAALPERAPGVVAIDGGREDVITKSIVTQFGNSFAIRPQLSDAGAEAQGFQDLCAGRVDIADSARTISSAETAACRNNGLTLASPIVVGSDALVMATKNEADVGGDCATVAQVRDIFRAGSPIANWDQLGFFNLPLSTTGRRPGTDIFDFFAFQVLGIENGATLGAVRSDYRPQPTDVAVRAAVTGNALAEAALFRERLRTNLVDRQTRAARNAFIRRAVVAADRQVLAEIARVNRDNARRKVRVDAGKLIRDNRIRDRRAKQQAAAMAARQFDVLLASGGQPSSTDPFLATAQRPGTVGFFRFTYYEQYEDQLRPLEIQPGGTPTTSTNGAAKQQAASQNGIDCVFPSRVTITNGTYSLARRIVLYTTTRALKRPEVQTFLRFYLTHAQIAATDDALVPITDQQLVQEVTAVTGRPPTTVTTTSTGGAGVPATTTTSTTTTNTAPAVAPSPVPGVAPSTAGGVTPQTGVTTK